MTICRGVLFPSLWRVSAVLLAASACGDDQVSEDEELARRFTPRPIQVAASSDFPDECLVAIDDAARFFGARSVSISSLIADPLTTPALNGTAQPGVIAVLPGQLPMTPTRVVHGETRLALTLGGDILGAEVILDGCDPRATTHELGHALGLVHVRIDGNLMHRELPRGGWDLGAEQLAWVAD